MTLNQLKRQMSALAAIVGLSAAGSLAMGVDAAYAQTDVQRQRLRGHRRSLHRHQHRDLHRRGKPGNRDRERPHDHHRW